MSRGSSSGKRPQAKLKAMAKLGENLYKTTKIYRYLAGTPLAKPKWQNFLANTSREHAAWKMWWDSPQSARWKNLDEGQRKPAPADDEAGR